MVTANNYIFRPLTGHHRVVHPKERGWAVQYTCMYIYCTVPTPFHWMYNLMMAR